MKKKVMSLLIVSLMTMSLLTGCASTSEKYFKLTEDMNKIEKASFDSNISILMDKTLLEEEENKLSSSEVEIPKEFQDDNGNLKIDINASGKIDIPAKKMDIDLKLADKSFNLVLIDEDAYVEIDGLFDILENFIGEEIGFVKMFLGDYDYIKASIDSSEENSIKIWDISTNQFSYKDDFKKKIKETKGMLTQKDGIYTLTLNDSDIKEIMKDNESFDDSLKTLTNGKEDPNMTMVIKSSFDKKTNTYKVDLSLVIDDYMTINAITTITPIDTVEINVPENVLDTDKDDLFGGESIIGDDDILTPDEPTTNENISNKDTSNSENWEDSEDINFGAIVENGVLSKFTNQDDYDNFKDYTTKKNGEFESAISKYGFSSASSSYDEKYLSSNFSTEKDIDGVITSVSQYIGEQYTNITYSIDMDAETLTDEYAKTMLKDVKEIMGIDIGTDKFIEALNKIRAIKVPEDEFGYTIYSDLDERDYELSITKDNDYYEKGKEVFRIDFEIFTDY